ncbi:hypothetical protein FRX31_029160, partial [Thalictrum thalictroides]
MASMKQSHETQLADMRTMIAQAENRAQDSEADAGSLRLELTETKNELVAAKAKNVMLDSEISKLKGDHRTESFAHECAMKAMKDQLGQLEAAIKEKDDACAAWYKDMEAKSALAIEERVHAEIE